MSTSKYDIATAEARDKQSEEVDSIGSLFPAPNEDRPTWIGRVFASVGKWLRSPRSRIAPLVVACVALSAGCSTSGPKMAGALGGAVAGFVLYHNYKVAESERWEKEEVAAGRTPLSPTNEALIRSDPVGYGLATVGGGAFGYGVAAWAEDRADKDATVNNTTYNDNRTLPEPVEAEPEAEAETGAGE